MTYRNLITGETIIRCTNYGCEDAGVSAEGFHQQTPMPSEPVKVEKKIDWTKPVRTTEGVPCKLVASYLTRRKEKQYALLRPDNTALDIEQGAYLFIVDEEGHGEYKVENVPPPKKKIWIVIARSRYGAVRAFERHYPEDMEKTRQRVEYRKETILEVIEREYEVE